MHFVMHWVGIWKWKIWPKKWKKDELRWFVFCFVQKSLGIFFSPYFWQDLNKKGIAFITRVTGLRLGLGGVGTNNTDFKESLSGRRVNQLSYLIAVSRRTFLYTINYYFGYNSELFKIHNWYTMVNCLTRMLHDIEKLCDIVIHQWVLSFYSTFKRIHY